MKLRIVDIVFRKLMYLIILLIIFLPSVTGYELARAGSDIIVLDEDVKFFEVRVSTVSSIDYPGGVEGLQGKLVFYFSPYVMWGFEKSADITVFWELEDQNNFSIAHGLSRIYSSDKDGEYSVFLPGKEYSSDVDSELPVTFNKGNQYVVKYSLVPSDRVLEYIDDQKLHPQNQTYQSEVVISVASYQDYISYTQAKTQFKANMWLTAGSTTLGALLGVLVDRKLRVKKTNLRKKRK